MVLDALLTLATSAYLGFQATVRLVVYPQLAAVPASAFVAYERRHQRLIGFVVGPLFAADAVVSVWAVAVEPGVATGIALGCFAGIVALTWLAAVPQHTTLSDGFDAGAYRRLLRVDTGRLVLAAGAVAAACAHLVSR